MRRALTSLAALASTLFVASTAAAQQFGGDVVQEPPASAPPPTAPAAPAPTPDAPNTPPAPEPPKKLVPIGLRLDGGYALRRLEQLPVTGADMGLAIGAQPMKNLAFWGAARFLIGGTENGLATKSLRLGIDLDVVVDRFRFMIEPGIFIVGVSRATRDDTISTWGPNLGLAARFDVIQSDGFAIFARAGVEGGPALSDTSFFGGATFGAGVDFDVRRGDRSSL